MTPEEKQQLADMKRNLDALNLSMGQLFPTFSKMYSAGTSNFSMRMPNLAADPEGPNIGSGIIVSGGVLKYWDGSAWQNASGGNFSVRNTWFDTIPQTANNAYGTIWVAPFACIVQSITETHKDAASGALTMDVLKSGTSLLSSQFNLQSVGGDVITTGSLASLATRTFAAGDRLHASFSGSVAGIRGVCVTVEFAPA